MIDFAKVVAVLAFWIVGGFGLWWIMNHVGVVFTTRRW